jgi:hypothetical protein
MPLPLIPLIFAAVAVGLGALTTYRLLSRIRDKNILTCGQPTVGKTTLAKALGLDTEGVIDCDGGQTIFYSANRKGKKIGVHDINITDGRSKICNESSDKKYFLEADIIFYIFNAKKVLDNDEDLIGRIKTEVKMYRLWTEKEQNKKRIIIALATHLDEIEGFSKETFKRMNSFAARLEDKAVIKDCLKLELGQSGNFLGVFYGSLKEEFKADTIARFLPDLKQALDK